MSETMIKKDPTYSATQWTGNNQQDLIDVVLQFRPYGELTSAEVDGDGALRLNFLAAGQFNIPADHYLVFGPIYGNYAETATHSIYTPTDYAEIFSAA